MLRYLAGVLFMQLLTLSSDALKVASLSSAKLGAAQKAILTAKRRQPCSCQPMPCFTPDGQECSSYSYGPSYSDASSSIPIIYVDDTDKNRTSSQNKKKSKIDDTQPMVWGDDGEVYPVNEYLDPEDSSLYPASNIPVVYIKGNRTNKTSGGNNKTSGGNNKTSGGNNDTVATGGSINGTGNGAQNISNGTGISSNGTGNGTQNSSNSSGLPSSNSSNSSGLPKSKGNSSGLPKSKGSPSGLPKSKGSCKTGRRGPPCADDSDCKGFDGCIRCVDSGYCTDGDNVDFDTTLNNLTMIVDRNVYLRKKQSLELPPPGGEQWDTDALFPDYLDDLISKQ